MLQITPACVILAEKLERAAKLLEDEGWASCRFLAKSGERCILGALHRVNGTSEHYGRAPKGAIQALGFASKADAMVWNDELRREGTEVIVLLRKTAAQQRELAETPRG